MGARRRLRRCGVHSNTFTLEWPPRSGRMREVPEVDRAEWFGLAFAREKINPAQVALLLDPAWLAAARARDGGLRYD